MMQILRSSKIHAFYFLLLGIALMVLSGCLVREETIIIDNDGNTSISVKIEGTIDDEMPVYAFPSEPDWKIRKHDIDTTDESKIELTHESAIFIPYGSRLPQNFVDLNTSDSLFYLQFPSEVKKWEDGNKIFYYFKRTYLARKYLRYNYLFEEEFDKKIEEKIFEKGIFNVADNERKQYLWQLSNAYQYSQLRLLSDILGAMVKEDNLPVSVKKSVEELCELKISKVIDEDKLLTILKNIEENLPREFDKFIESINRFFIDAVIETVSKDNSSMIAFFEKRLASQRLENKITEDIESHDFGIILSLPGEIIATNGLTDKDEPGYVAWEFKGVDLQDRDIPLYALSVVEK